MPNLPTDNLYKFMALSGLFLFCFSLYFITTKVDALEERVYKDGIAYSEWKVKAEALEKEIDHLTTEKSLAAQKSIEVNESLKSKLLEHNINLAKVKHATLYSKNNLEQIKHYQQIGFWLKVVSLLLSIFGFALWYFRVQKYQDIALKNEALNPTASE